MKESDETCMMKAQCLQACLHFPSPFILPGDEMRRNKGKVSLDVPSDAQEGEIANSARRNLSSVHLGDDESGGSDGHVCEDPAFRANLDNNISIFHDSHPITKGESAPTCDTSLSTASFRMSIPFARGT